MLFHGNESFEAVHSIKRVIITVSKICLVYLVYVLRFIVYDSYINNKLILTEYYLDSTVVSLVTIIMPPSIIKLNLTLSKEILLICI